MAGSLTTVWARYKTLFIWWGFTLLLIGAALGIQWWEADLAGRYTAVQRAENCPLQVVVTYPRQLLLPVANTPQQPLLIQVANAQNVEYTISLSKADWFLLYDQDGNIISSHWDGTGDAVFTAVVKTYPDSMASPEKHQIELTETGNQFSCVVDLGEISVETVSNSRWRLAFGIFARNIALPLGLLSAIAGWVVSYLGKETDKLDASFREKMGKLATEFLSDPLYAVEQCVELRRLVDKKSLGSDAEKELVRVVRSLVSPRGVGRLLKQIGEFANQKDQIRLMSALASIVTFHEVFAADLNQDTGTDRIFLALEQIHSYFSEQRNLTLLDASTHPREILIGKRNLPPFVKAPIERFGEWRKQRRISKAKKVIEQLLGIWDEQDVYSADFVIYGLNKFQNIDSISTFLKDAIQKSPKRRRLMRYKSLAWLGDSLEPYEWPPLRATEPIRYSALNRWFASKPVINANPFEPSPRADALLLDSRLKISHQPEGWEILANNHSGVFASSCYEDLLSAALLLQDFFQDTLFQSVFPILLEYSDEWQESDLLAVLAHRAAETWLEFLAYSPDAYLDMYPEERRALASWFCWHCGSVKIAVERLRQRLFHVWSDAHEEKKVTEKKKAGELLLDFLKESESPYSKDSPPSGGQFLEWLNIRPFGIEQTVILLLSGEQLPEAITRSIENYQESFSQRHIVLKQFSLEKDISLERAFQIKWSKEQLKQILAVRIDLVSGGRKCFTELFEISRFDATDYDEQLAEKARGSFHRMLALGLKILFHHAQHYPHEPFLLPEDFSAIDNL
jgi:hypothetical protein